MRRIERVSYPVAGQAHRLPELRGNRAANL